MNSNHLHNDYASRELLDLLEDFHFALFSKDDEALIGKRPIMERIWYRVKKALMLHPAPLAKRCLRENMPIERWHELRRNCAMSPKPRLVVFTCVTGGYDSLRDPLCNIENVTYVAFSDCEHPHLHRWAVRPIPDKLKHLANPMINRYIKFHPHEFFGDDFDYAVYVDGNALIVSDYTPFIALQNEKFGISMHAHCLRDDVYKEGRICIGLGKGNKKHIRRYLRDLRAEGFPAHYGLLECTIILTNLKNEEGRLILSETFEELLASECGRDQLILPHVLWKKHIVPKELATLGDDVYKDPVAHVWPH